MTRKEVEALWGTIVTAEYNPNIAGFGVFLEVLSAQSGECMACIEMNPKKARKFAKAILKVTKKGSNK